MWLGAGGVETVPGLLLKQIDHLWYMLQARLLFEAQMMDSSTAPCLRLALNGLEDELTEGVRENVGDILTAMMADRMSPAAFANGTANIGPAKSPQHAFEQANILPLLEALDHPSAELYEVARPDDMPQEPQAAVNETHKAAGEIQATKASNGQHKAEGQGQRAQAESSQPEQAGKRGKKRPAAQPSSRAMPLPNHAAGPEQKQPPQQLPHQRQQANQQQQSQQQPAQQRQQQQQQLHQQPYQPQQQQAQAPVAASYGPEEQAEAKRQAKKEAALAWLDKAKAAAKFRSWESAVSSMCCAPANFMCQS